MEREARYQASLKARRIKGIMADDMRVLAALPLDIFTRRTVFTSPAGYKIYAEFWGETNVTNSLTRLKRLKLVRMISSKHYANVWEPLRMRHNLTDFDHGVLAAMALGIVKVVRVDTSRVNYTLNGVNIWPSLLRLEQAGELRITPKQELLFPGTEKWRKYEEMLETVRLIKIGIRDGSIKLDPPLKPKRTKP